MDVIGTAALGTPRRVSSGDQMRTGKLLKFQRPGGDVHAYVYREEGAIRAALYVMSPGKHRDGEPVHAIEGTSGSGVEADVRAWVDRHFPRSG